MKYTEEAVQELKDELEKYIKRCSMYENLLNCVDTTFLIEAVEGSLLDKEDCPPYLLELVGDCRVEGWE